MVPSANLIAHLRRHASWYFEDVCGEPVHVELRRTSRRTNSTLHEFVVGGGETEHVVLVKQPPRAPAQSLSGPDRPRLFPKSRPELKSRFEYRAMAAIERHIARMGDPRFGAVRVLELLPDQQSLVMEKARERSLSGLLLRALPLPPRLATRERLGRIMRNCGSWLRRYHGLPGLKHTESRGAGRAVFVDAISRFTAYLARATGRPSFERLGAEMADVAEAVLPPELPLGLGHGDYAPRNVLTALTGQIRVIDTQGRWKAPIYEDISHFLTAIKASTPQVLTGGRFCRPRTAAYLERHFLAGYFEDQSVPLDRIRLFECQTLVERWSAMAYRAQESHGWKRLAKGGRAVWAHRFLRNLVDQLLAEAHAAPAATILQSDKVVR